MVQATQAAKYSGGLFSFSFLLFLVPQKSATFTSEYVLGGRRDAGSEIFGKKFFLFFLFCSIHKKIFCKRALYLHPNICSVAEAIQAAKYS